MIHAIEGSWWQRIKSSHVLVVLVIAYLLLGIRPFVPIENDGMRITLGIQSDMLYRSHKYAYDYDVQAGTYVLSEILANTFALKPFDALSLLTALSCIIFFGASVNFIKRIVHTSYIIAFGSFVLFQETWVAGYYPNSSMVAACFLQLPWF